MTIPFTPATIQPSRDLFSMDKVAFPRILRQKIAELELQVERGEPIEDGFEARVKALVELSMWQLGLKYEDGWTWYPTPPARHNPDGHASVWWRFR